MKWLVGIVILIVVAVAGFYAFNNYIYRQKQQPNDPPPASQAQSIDVTPISHASMILNIGGQVIYNDPVGGAEAYEGKQPPTIILISDIHGDHFDAPTLEAISTDDTVIVLPQAVFDILPEGVPGERVVLANGQTTTQGEVAIQAVPMYNLPEGADSRHTKGRGNGYVLEADGKRIYIAGDTSATPEMRALQNIDVAFVPMNPPFTMTVEEAAQAVVDFKPKIVHPYHFRGQDGLSDVDAFKDLVEKGDPDIRVELLNFYPGQAGS